VVHFIAQRRLNDVGFFTVLAAIPGFFVSSLILMALWSVIAPNFGIRTIDYPMAMLINITLWLAVAPLVAAARRGGRRWRGGHAGE
jgi:hypothetical protein